MASGSLNSDRSPSAEIDYVSDPASGSFFSSDFKKHEDLKQMLDSNKDGLKLEAMKRIIGMVAKGRDTSELFPAVVKNVVSANLEVKKLVYVYLVRYAEEQQDLALLSISTFQRALKDPNQLIRACALRVLSSIRVPVIVPIMMLSIKDAVTDMSPYVRKTAAHAIPKLYSLDPEQKDELIQVLEKLLSDKTTLVVGSAVMAFEEVCPERIDLIHKNYRKLCNLLVDVEEWGQVVIVNMLTRYARTQFVDPNLGVTGEEPERPFYDDEEQGVGEVGSPSKGHMMDADHRLLLRNTRPLLQSRNTAVVLAVAQLYQHVAPASEVSQVARALIRLLRGHREVQAVVLTNVASMSTRRKGMFEPYLKSFFVRSSDPTHIKILKLEVLTNLATDANILVILREFQTYIGSSDKDFVAASIQAIGRCASNIREVTDTCLNGLVSLLSSRDELVVGESVVVIRKLLQSESVGHRDIISHMARLLSNIKIPMARASILWLLGEYCDRVPKIAPDVLRQMAKSFVNEDDIVKLQVLTLATKLYLTNPKQTALLCQYVYNLAKYDANYDIRDRVRLMRAMIFPPQGEELPPGGSENALSKHAKKIFLAPKPAPLQQSSFQDRNHFQLGTLSHFVNARAAGYRDLPPFPEVAPDPCVRNVETPTPWESSSVRQGSATMVKKNQSAKSFYSDDGSREGGSEGDIPSSSSDSSSATEDEPTKNSGWEKNKKQVPSVSGSEDSESDSSTTDSSSSDSSKEDTDSGVEESESNVIVNEPAAARSNLDLLLDLDPPPGPSVGETPMLTPSMGGWLTPMTSENPPAQLSAGSSVQLAATTFVPTTSQELLSRITGNGLAVSARFTRSPHLYSPCMTAVELTFTNHGAEELRDVAPGRKRSPTMHDFAAMASLATGTPLHGTLGVDFGDTTQAANFEVVVGGCHIYNLSLSPPVGELLSSVSMSAADFVYHQSKLRGMNELSGSVVIPNAHMRTKKGILERIYEAANVLQVPTSDADENLLKFGGQTTSGKVLVLVSINTSTEQESATVTINCEKMVISSMLLKQLLGALGKS